MPPDRSSPSLRPTSPLSPKQTNSLQLPSQRGFRTSKQRTGNASLRLPALPRYHPANFPSSQHGSEANTPASGFDSPQPPHSPRSQQHLYSEAQQQLYMHQREVMANAGRGIRPVSPRLAPLGSPGPVTPLMLEEQSDYMVAGAQSSAVSAQEELVQKLMEDESQRWGDMSPRRLSPSVGGQ
ncbi:hypothetical protein BJ546DRAFT_432258 [Cryomyces antarcticus]